MGKLVELPCNIGDTVYGVAYLDCADGETEDEKRAINEYCKLQEECDTCMYTRPGIREFRCAKITITEKNTFVYGEKDEYFHGDEIFTDKAQAEARLQELREKKAAT